MAAASSGGIFTFSFDFIRFGALRITKKYKKFIKNINFTIKFLCFIGQFSKISVQALRFNKTRILVILDNLFFFTKNSKFFQKSSVLEIAVLLLSVRSIVRVSALRGVISYTIDAKTQKIVCTLSTSTAIFIKNYPERKPENLKQTQIQPSVYPAQ